MNFSDLKSILLLSTIFICAFSNQVNAYEDDVKPIQNIIEARFSDPSFVYSSLIILFADGSVKVRVNQLYHNGASYDMVDQTGTFRKQKDNSIHIVCNSVFSWDSKTGYQADYFVIQPNGQMFFRLPNGTFSPVYYNVVPGNQWESKLKTWRLTSRRM